jgi:hypothetical protein
VITAYSLPISKNIILAKKSASTVWTVTECHVASRALATYCKSGLRSMQFT